MNDEEIQKWRSQLETIDKELAGFRDNLKCRVDELAKR
jgi:hypothetical protein